MSFADPLVLLGLLAIPLLVVWYVGEQRRRSRVAEVFVAPALGDSVAPRRPRWRRHAPMLAFALALAVLVVAAARPQRSVAKPLTNGTVMLADDVSGSMQATDVSPSRLRAAQRAAERFLAGVPSTIETGLIEFARSPRVVQSPTGNRALTESALAQPVRTSGGTAIGEAILTAVREIRSVPRVGGKRPPGAIVLISDGTSNVGTGPMAAAQQAAASGIHVYTISVGTPNGTIRIRQGSRTVTAPVPVSRAQLAMIARVSRGRAYTASDAAGVSAAYQDLAARLGRKQVKQEITAGFAGGALVLLLMGSALSLRWFGRLV
jgi:Ca-activated chloride channel family protein